MTSNTPENPSGKAPVGATPQPPAYPAYGQQPPAYTPPPAYSQAPYGQPAPYGQMPPQDPGKTMAIIAVILPFVGLGLGGLILGIIAKVKSKKAGYKNTLALVAIIISSVAIVLSIIGAIAFIVFVANVSNELTQLCQDGSSTVVIQGQQVPCPVATP